MNQNKQTKDQRPKTKDLEKIEIACQQSFPRLNLKNIRIILREILRLTGLSSAYISAVFCDNKFIARLNRRYFKKFRATDVMSFPLCDTVNTQYLGEIIVSTEQAKKTCKFYGKKWQEELTLYLTHGILHLIGYNDIKKKERMIMEKKQEGILVNLLKRHKGLIDNIGR